MNASPVHYSLLAVKNPVFRIARMAVADTIGGGCGALILAKRARRMGLPMARELYSAVSDVYASSSGRVPSHLTPWQCNECGSIHETAESAEYCCSDDEAYDQSFDIAGDPQ